MKLSKITILAVAASLSANLFAQSTSPDPSVSVVALATDNNQPLVGPSIAFIGARGKAVGYLADNQLDPNNAAFPAGTARFASTFNDKLNIAASSIFAGSTSVATAQSIFSKFALNSSIEAGQSLQFGIHAYAFDQSETLPFVDVFASIYEEGAAGSGVPLGALVASNVRVRIGNGTQTVASAQLWYSDVFTTSTALSSSKKYWLAIAPSTAAGSTTPANSAIIVGNPWEKTGLGALGYSQTDFQNVWVYKNNTAAIGGANGVNYTSGLSAYPTAFRLLRGTDSGFVSGTVNLPGYTASLEGIQATFEVRPVGSLVAAFETTVPLGATGNFAFASNLPAGNYDVWVKTSNALAKVATNQAVSGSFTIDLALGDLDDNNIVDFDDLSIIATNYETATSSGDADGNGFVDFDDLSVIATNYELSGDAKD